MTAKRAGISPRAPVSSESFLDRLCVVLVAARNPLNIGAAARAMTNFGFSQLRVVNPYEVAFREAKSAVGASAVLKRAEEYPNVAEAVADCTLVIGTTAVRDRQLDHPLRTLQQGTSVIRRRMRTGHVALLFGSEKRGLSNQDFTHCDWLLQIPTRPEQPSMNLGQAVAVCLYEISRGSKATLLSERQPSATAGELERLSASFLDALRASGYAIKGRQDEEVLRRLVHRLKLSGADAQLLLGMLRQMRWKMGNRS
jgi:TrmH family RNA methyltransferase